MERLYSVLGLLSLDAAAHPATFEQVEVLQSCLPQARDELLRTFTLDSTTLATMFPFLSNSLMMPGGVLVGVSETHEPVLLNPWDASLENPHLFIGGVTGSGKSYLGKLLVERDLLAQLAARRPVLCDRSRPGIPAARRSAGWHGGAPGPGLGAAAQPL